MTKATLTKAAGLGLLIALSLITIACPGKKPKYPTCDNAKDCKEGEFCVNKACVKCRADSDCAEGEQCLAGACKAKKNWCDSDDACPPEQTCKDHKCQACTADSECGEGGKCQAGKCQRKGMCTVDEDCAEDEFCQNGRCSKGQTSNNPPAGCTLTAVYFEFDAAGLSDDARGTLAANADCIKTQGKGVQVVGHTDPRGTEEYNLTLSERRARSVRDYLAPLVGALSSKMRVVPKGELEAGGADETGWSQDRRVEFLFE